MSAGLKSCCLYESTKAKKMHSNKICISCINWWSAPKECAVDMKSKLIDNIAVNKVFL